MEISEKIRTLRKEAGMSQEELADRIGVSRQAVTKWETSAGLPDLYNIKALAEVFGISVDDLLRGDVASAEQKEGMKTCCMYDITEPKVFDIRIGACRSLVVKEASEGKVEVLTNTPYTVIKIDEHKGLIDIDFKKIQGVGDTQCKENLDIEILLPSGMVKHVEMDAICTSVKLYGIKSDQIELGGKFGSLELSGNSGHIEIDCNLDLEIVLKSIDGRIDINQWKATSTLSLDCDTPVAYLCEGRRCKLHLADSIPALEYSKDEKTNLITLNGYCSELTVRK